MKLIYQKLSEDAIAPTKAHDNDMGFDLYLPEDCYIGSGERLTVPLGISVKFPELDFLYGISIGGFIKEKSGLASKLGLSVLGGVIDPGYTGELKVVVINTDSDKVMLLNAGDKIAQLVVMPFMAFSDVEEGIVDRNTGRGDGGFGSTGK